MPPAAYPEVLRTQVCGSLGPSVGRDDDDDDDDVGEKYSRRLPVETTLYIWPGRLQKNQIPPSLWHVRVHEFFFLDFRVLHSGPAAAMKTEGL